MKSQAIAITAFLAVMLAQACLAEENITELKIETITTPIRAGETLEFSYLLGNNSGPACSAKIQYWFEENEERLVQGNDSVYLEEGQQKTETASLIMPPGLEGTRNFYLEMQCNDSTILASRVIHIGIEIPKLPQFKSIEVEESQEGSQAEFSYSFESSQGTVPVQVEERITQDGNTVWTNGQSIAVTGTTEVSGLGPSLPPGNYKLTVQASTGNETATISREFTVKAVTPPAGPGLVTTGLIALLFAVMAAIGITAARLYSPKGSLFGSRRKAIKNRVCSVESESSGFLEELQLGSLLDDIGFSGKKRQRAIRAASATPVEQVVRSCAVTYKNGSRDFETTVTATIRNSTNTDWENITAVLRIPSFLEEDITSVEADSAPEILEGTNILRFRLSKIGAMQSTVITYKAAKIVSQAEANSIQLPAVIGYKKGQPLVITQVKAEALKEPVKGAKEAKTERRQGKEFK